MKVKLLDITYSRFLSFDTSTTLPELASHNVIIGRNNSGKSNLIRPLQMYAHEAHDLNAGLKLPPQTTYQGVAGDATAGQATFRLKISDKLRHEMIQVGIAAAGTQAEFRRVSVLLSDNLGDVLQIGYRFEKGSYRHYFAWPEGDIAYSNYRKQTDPPDALQSFVTGGLRSALFQFLHRNLTDSVRYVGAWRGIHSPTRESNKSIPENLHAWFGPPVEEAHLRRRFDAIQSLFNDLMMTKEIALQPEAGNPKNLLLSWKGRYLPFDSFGAGVAHLLMLAYELVVKPDAILLVEEPETHLHPASQRHLYDAIVRESKGQTLITTHSPVLLDAQLANTVYRVEYDGLRSNIVKCSTPSDTWRILDLLDARASDILQANCVIWVEGPTDRQFLKRCFELMNTGFAEGYHYQIVFYGGKLRSHLSFTEDELVRVVSLSRNSVMVCDSDRSVASDPLDKTKERLKSECGTCNGFFWVTEGREIENYLPDSVLSAAMSELLEQEVELTLAQFERLPDILHKAIPNPPHGKKQYVNYEDNKALLMPAILKYLAKEHLTRYDLSDRLNELVRFIRSANRLPEPTPNLLSIAG